MSYYKRINSLLSIHLGHTNCFLLKTIDGYLLIDTSFPQYYDDFKKIINENSINLMDIKYLFLTHHHDDHAGFAEQLKEDTNCTLIIHKDGIEPLTSGKMTSKNIPLNSGIKIIMSIFNTVKKRSFSIRPVTISNTDIIIEQEIDSVTLPKLGIDGIILHTIGHTQDSISIVCKNGNCFPGDICMNWFNVCGTHYRPIFITDKTLVKNSWNILIKNGAKILYPSHGNPFKIEELKKSNDKYL